MGTGGEKMEVEGGGPPMHSADQGKAVARPRFEPLTAHEMSGGKVQFRKVSVPPHRFSPLKKAWMEIYTPIYEQMKVDVRMNLKTRKVELKTRADTPDIGNLQKCRGTESSKIKRSGKGKEVKKLKKGVDNKFQINEDDDMYQISLGEESSKRMMNTENVSSGKAKKSALSKTKKQTMGIVINAEGDTKTSEIKRSGKGKKVKKKLKKDMDNKFETNEDDDVCQISSGDEDSSKGMMKWLSEYYQCRPGVQILQQRIDDYIMAYDEKEERERKKREAEAGEGGWTVVVHHKGRKKTTDEESGVTVGAVSQASVLDKIEKKKDKIASDFYNFQKREAKRNELLMLQNKFEEDKKRIQHLRAARKFRPY